MTTWPRHCLLREISVSGNLEYLNLLLISHDSVPAGWRGRAEARDLERHNLGLIWPAAAQQASAGIKWAR